MENDKHPYKAEAVRINRADEQTKLIISENKTKMKQWKARTSIFIESVKGWVQFLPLSPKMERRKASRTQLKKPSKAILSRPNYRLLLSAFTLLRTSAYVYMVLVMVLI